MESNHGLTRNWGEELSKLLSSMFIGVVDGDMLVPQQEIMKDHHQMPVGVRW